MTKRLLAFLMALILCVSLAACTGEEPDSFTGKTEPTDVLIDDTGDTDKSSSDDNDFGVDDNIGDSDSSQTSSVTPLLYKVTDSNGNVVWLFGSIHIGVEDMYPLPTYIMDAYNGSEALAVECDIIASSEDMQASVAMMQKMMYTDGTLISDHIDAETYEAAVEILQENNYYMEYFDYFMPVMWMSLIDGVLQEKLEYQSDLGIDYQLLTLAKDQGKPILEVESVEFQSDMLASFSAELQEILLQSSIASYSDLLAAQEYEDLMSLWCNGDEAAFSAYLSSDDAVFASEEEKRLYEEYNNAMIVERNINMTDYAETALKSGEEIFICVGAAHVVGEDAMADLLEERGYTVEIVR